MTEESLGTSCTSCGLIGPLSWFDVGGSNDERGTLWCNDCGKKFVAEIVDVRITSEADGVWERVS